MSLKVWLPLNGTVVQQGVSQVTAVVNGATVNTSGKIGSCYSFDGSDDYISLNGTELYPIFTGGAQKFSICFWVYHADATRAIIFGDYGLSGTIQFNIELTTSHGVRFYWAGSPDKNFNSTSYVTASGWTHIALTYDGTKINIYRNGILSSDVWSGTLSTKNKTSGMFYLGRDNRTGTTAFNGRLNDFRIYDHCLSAVEVKEISQGLVLHYKLDSFQGGYGNPNIIVTHSNAGVDGTGTSGWSTAGTGWSNSFVSATGATGGYAIRCTYANTSQTSGGIHHPTGIDKTTLTTGDIYTLSARIRTSKACIVTFQNELMTTGHSINATTEWQVYTYTCAIDTSKTYQSNVMYVRAADAEQNMWIECDWIKLEKGATATPWQPYGIVGTAIQDSSGYGHNGILNDTTIKISNDTARYSAALLTSQANNSATYPIKGECNMPESSALTFAWWMKPTIIGYQTSGIFSTSNNDTPTDYNTTAANMRDSCFDCCNVSGTCVRINVASYLTINEWHHYALTYNGSQLNFYKDGVSKVTLAQTGALKAFQYIFPFYSKAGGSNRTTSGGLSDFRIYCTALSDDDVSALYHTCAKVDNLQNLHTFEVKETNNNLLAGRLWTNGYSQHNPFSGLFTNFNSAGEYQFTANSTSAGSEYIPINPTGHTYEYDYTISVNAGNQFYIGFERYDANKTSRSNNACIYIYQTKPSSDIVKQHFKGTVDLSTDGTNPCAFIALRILNGWSGTTSGVTGTATIHTISLREVGTMQTTKLTKTGQFIEEEIKEENETKIQKNGIVETNNLIEL